MKSYPTSIPANPTKETKLLPEAIISFLDAGGYEDGVRNAVSLGGDSDTLACITGAIAEAYYGPVAGHILDKVKKLLASDLLVITDRFCLKYRPDGPAIDP